jgi:hypothetical protein
MVTQYPVIALAFADEAVQVTVAWPVPGVACTAVGAFGLPTMIDADAPEIGPEPWLFVAATRKAYHVPFVSPGTAPDVDEAANVSGERADTPLRYGVTV